jgi:gas vesicle protein
MFKSKKMSYVDFVEVLLIGGSLGAMATFMLGTEKGKKLQKEMIHKYKMLGHKVEHFRDDVVKVAKSPAAKKIKRAAKALMKTPTARKAKRKALRSRK